MLQPGRNVSAGNYRYGFNGKEQDTAINGSGVDYDYGFRIYDARVGRFYSIDPLQKKYPSETPYHFCGNNPTNYADKDGRDTFRIYNSTVVYPPINSKLDGVVISKGGTVSNSTYSIARSITVNVLDRMMLCFALFQALQFSEEPVSQKFTKSPANVR